MAMPRRNSKFRKTKSLRGFYSPKIACELTLDKILYIVFVFLSVKETIFLSKCYNDVVFGNDVKWEISEKREMNRRPY